MSNFNTTLGQAAVRAGPPTDPIQGNSINSCSERLSQATGRIFRMRDKVERLANDVMSTQPTEVSKDRLDHPPCSLQEHIAHLEDALDRLDMQIGRFY